MRFEVGGLRLVELEVGWLVGVGLGLRFRFEVQDDLRIFGDVRNPSIGSVPMPM